MRFFLCTVILCAKTLAALLVVGGDEKILGPDVEVEKILGVLYSGADRNLNSGT
jgi:hypothetical protein